MFSKIIRWIFTLAALALAALVVLNRGNYTSLLPHDFNIVELIAAPKDSLPEPIEVKPLEMLEQIDSLDVNLVDTLPIDTLKVIENN
ncbi:MAG: hypothetical protein SNF93_01085 [Rikenellaceae bacterium]